MSILDNEGHDPNGLGNRDTGWAKGYAAGKASLQGELDWQRAESERLTAEVERLREALKTCPCPGNGWNGMPEGMEATVGNCYEHKVCGCIYGIALGTGEQFTP